MTPREIIRTGIGDDLSYHAVRSRGGDDGVRASR
jgi:hypothetical protein